MNQTPFVITDVAYPTNLVETIKEKGDEYDIKELFKSGMVLVFTCLIKPEEQPFLDEIMRSTQEALGNKTLICDLDEVEKEAKTAFKFIKGSKKIGTLVFWLFNLTYVFSEMFSNEKIDELNNDGVGHNGYYGQKIQLVNEDAKKAGNEHWIVFVSTHEYFVKEPYLSILLKQNSEKLNKKFNGKTKKTNHRTQITKSIRHEVLKRDGYKCKECGTTQKESTLHIDHITPVSEGGTDELSNFQTLCSTCNLSKSNRKWNGGI